MNICVFCASSAAENSVIEKDAENFASLLAKLGHNLVYGGASVGIMGLIARKVLSENGKVIGIMPKSLTGREIASQEITEKYIVGSMAERKTMMTEKSDAFVILPGGLGTLDELFEVACLSSLGLCRKPIVVLNSDGYYDCLRDFFNRAHKEKFVEYPTEKLIVFASSPEEVFSALENYELPPIPSWIKLDEH